MTQNTTVLEGIISIRSAVEGKSRRIDAVYVDEKKIRQRDRKAIHFTSFLKHNNIEYTLASRDYIDSLVSDFAPSGTEDYTKTGSSHGGFIALAGDRISTPLSDFLDGLSDSGSYAVFLDGVEDPFNFGYSVRNLYAFGTYGFILPKRNWLSASNVVARSSAGASELCNISISENDISSIELIKQKNIDIVCAALSGKSVSLYDFKPQRPFILFIGGEKRGISKEFIENANTIVHIPYTNKNAMYSLPTASAAAIFASTLSQAIPQIKAYNA